MAKLPFAPLSDAIGELYSPQRVRNQHGERDGDRREWVRHPGEHVSHIAEIAGVSRRSVLRWQKSGVDVEMADRIACALGLHVSLIWPEWFTESD